MSETKSDLLLSEIGAWMGRLESYPGWKEWKRRHLVSTLHFDDRLLMRDEIESEFKFSDEMEREHAVVIKYLGLHQTIGSLKECEFYFRRYPFRGLPVTRHGHVTNVCEMYFGRFYEFKERLKSYFDALGKAAPEHNLDVGGFIRLFERTFNQEIRSRNSINHHNRFEDIAIDRVFLTDSISIQRDEKGWKQEHLAAYRKLTSEWAQRVVERGKKMDEFLEAVASATLMSCRFLSMKDVEE
jgi:hypothetical protein